MLHGCDPNRFLRCMIKKELIPHWNQLTYALNVGLRPQALASGQEIDRVQNGRLGNILLWPKVELLDALNNLGYQLLRG